MNNKKRVLIGTIVILGLSFLFHSVYEKLPNLLTALFFSVNESIFEHNKMILLSFVIWGIVEKIFFNKDKNVIFATLIETLLCILLLDLTFTPIYLYILKKKENLTLTIIIYGISILLSLIIGNRLLKESDQKQEIFSSVGLIIVSIVLMILTYYPPKLAIFYDYKNNTYGIPVEKQ